MSSDLIARLRAAGDSLHLLAADALVAEAAEVARLRDRALLLEAVARLNAETICARQKAARGRRHDSVSAVIVEKFSLETSVPARSPGSAAPFGRGRAENV